MVVVIPKLTNGRIAVAPRRERGQGRRRQEPICVIEPTATKKARPQPRPQLLRSQPIGGPLILARSTLKGLSLPSAAQPTTGAIRGRLRSRPSLSAVAMHK